MRNELTYDPIHAERAAEITADWLADVDDDAADHAPAAGCYVCTMTGRYVGPEQEA